MRFVAATPGKAIAEIEQTLHFTFMTFVDIEERRARLAIRHRLTADTRAASAEQVTESLVAVHATDPATVFLSISARMRQPSFDEIEHSLYLGGLLRRMHGVRRTVFVVPTALVPVVHHSAAVPIAVKERKTLLKFADGLGESWLTDVEASVLALLQELGEATATELSAREARLKERVVIAPGRPYGAELSIGGRLLTTLAMEGKIIRRKPRGTWNSNQFRWSVAPQIVAMPEAQARAELIRSWLAAFGPGTEADLKWWTGWSLGQVREALSALRAQQVQLEGDAGYVLQGDTDATLKPGPWAALLPALDSTAMGWKDRSWYLPQEHVAPLFDRTGNIGPTVWWNGSIVGGWAHRADGTIVYRLMSKVNKRAIAAIETEVRRVSGWLARAVVVPRFRTPLERELSA